MTYKRNHLTQEQLADARIRFYEHHEPMSHIARRLKVKSDWLKCLLDPEYHAARCARRAEAARRKRRENPERKHAPILHPSVRDTIVVPREVLVEREARRRAPLSLSAMFFGDPPHGYSALDRMGRQ